MNETEITDILSGLSDNLLGEVDKLNGLNVSAVNRTISDKLSLDSFGPNKTTEEVIDEIEKIVVANQTEEPQPTQTTTTTRRPIPIIPSIKFSTCWAKLRLLICS